MPLLTKIREALKAQRRYYREDRASIAEENLATMRIAGSIGTLVAIVFFTITPAIIPSWSITKEYVYVLPVLLMAFLFSYGCKIWRKTPKPLVVEIACAAFYVLLLAVFTALSVFPYPDSPQIFISLCFMFMPVLLILRPTVLLSIMTVSQTVFMLLACKYKTTVSVQADIFNTIAAFIFSLIIILITNRLRRKNFLVRMELQALSETDMLTGILNKKAFEGRCEAFLRSSGKEKHCALFILDIDDFKVINDTLGHPAGDALLREVGGVLLGAFRQKDCIGRIGGDEFAVLVLDDIDEASLAARCRLLHERLKGIILEGKPFPTSCSIGVVYADESGADYTELFRLADEALYRVKRGVKGSDSVVAWRKSKNGAPNT